MQSRHFSSGYQGIRVSGFGDLGIRRLGTKKHKDPIPQLPNHQIPISRYPNNLLMTFVILVSSLVIFFSGCGPKPATKTATTITVWHWMTDREPAFLELAKRYETETGVKVNFELYAPSDAYTQKVRAAAQANTLPDIYGILGEKRDFASFIKSGYVADLTEDMLKDNSVWKDSLFEKALGVNEFKENNEFSVKPGIYGVPIDVMNIQMLYNKRLLKKAGWDPNAPPRTWSEFLEAGKKLKEAGIQGFISGWGEVWMIDCFASNYAFNIMGEDKVMETIRGKVPYTDNGWLDVFGLFKQMRDVGLFASGVVTMVNKNAEQNFANERAAFAFNGSWCVNVYQGMNPNLDYGAMLPPQASDKYPMRIWGGAGSSFMANERSRTKAEAVKFLKWLTGQEQQAYLSKATKNLPSNKKTLSEIPVILAQFAKVMDNTTHPSIWPVTEFPAVIETFDKGIQSIIIGEKTPLQVAQEVQKIKERELSKKR